MIWEPSNVECQAWGRAAEMGAAYQKARQRNARRSPGKEALAWVTNAVTLITGRSESLLVDTFLSKEHNNELADWIAAKGKRLALIYITHGHPDHFFGLKILKERFPEARMLARHNVVK